MQHESSPETLDEKKEREATQVTGWVDKYGPRAKERHQAEQVTAWVKEHGGADERHRTLAENEYWTRHLDSEGVTTLRNGYRRAEAMGLKEEAVRLKKEYDAAVEAAGESFKARKETLFKGIEAALADLRKQPVWEDMSHEDVSVFISADLNEADFEYLAAIQGKPILSRSDEIDDDELGRFIVLEQRSDTLSVILTEYGRITYLQGTEGVAEAKS